MHLNLHIYPCLCTLHYTKPIQNPRPSSSISPLLALLISLLHHHLAPKAHHLFPRGLVPLPFSVRTSASASAAAVAPSGTRLLATPASSERSMGNCNCLERARVTAWDGGDDDDGWGLPAAERYSGRARAAVSSSTENGGGMRVKIRMTKGQLRRLLETSGRGGASDEDVVAEIMRMGTVRVDVAELQQAAERQQPPKLEAIQEDDVDE